MKQPARILLLLFLATISFQISNTATGLTYGSIIPESDWIKLTEHSQGADSPAWTPDGSEIFYITWDETSLGTLYKMDADGTNHVSYGIYGVEKIGYPAVSPDGTKISMTGFGYVWLVNYDGINFHHIYGIYSGGTCIPGAIQSARWSPTGDKLAVDEMTSCNPHKSQIVVIDSDGSNPTVITGSEQGYFYPGWSPDGTKIAYNSFVHPVDNARGWNADIWVMDSDGQNHRRLTQFDDACLPVWSPDGSSIFFTRQPGSSGTERHIFRMDADGTNIVQLTDSGGEWWPAISPNGEWMAFTAFDENGDQNIYKTELPSSVEATADVDPDTLNLKSNGEWITAYITLPEGYSVEDIDVASVELIHNDFALAADWGEVQDGVLMVKFDRATLRNYLGEVDVDDGDRFYDIRLTVRGNIAGRLFIGSDTISVKRQ